MAHEKEMAVLKLKGEELHFTGEMRRKQDQDDRVKLGSTQRSNLMEFTSRVRTQEKEKECKRKEMEKQKKTKAAVKRLSLSHATARMNQTTMPNGGAFPRPGVSLHEPSCFRFLDLFIRFLDTHFVSILLLTNHFLC
jgi:hypothetical protein